MNLKLSKASLRELEQMLMGGNPSPASDEPNPPASDDPNQYLRPMGPDVFQPYWGCPYCTADWETGNVVECGQAPITKAGYFESEGGFVTDEEGTIGWYECNPDEPYMCLECEQYFDEAQRYTSQTEVNEAPKYAVDPDTYGEDYADSELPPHQVPDGPL